jgi:hypothetical protein
MPDFAALRSSSRDVSAGAAVHGLAAAAQAGRSGIAQVGDRVALVVACVVGDVAAAGCAAAEASPSDIGDFAPSVPALDIA